jgi:signal transduction histidine kinase
MRRLLGAMRDDGEDAARVPQPGLRDLDGLLDGVERAGLPVRLRIDGEPFPLPDAPDVSAYRIVQEALTNALKHAGPARAEVVLRFGARALDIEVRDDGRGAAVPNGDGAGHGLIGMRERVALYGGQLDAGPRRCGGFEIRARLPLS